MSKYAFDTPSGRVEEALLFLGMGGPLALAEDALAALDMLHDAFHLAKEELRILEESQIPMIPSGAQAKMERLEAHVAQMEAALRQTPCVLHCNEIGKCAGFGFTCARCAALASAREEP